MLSKVVLLLDKRRELSTKYKKLLEQNNTKVFVSDTAERAFELLCEYEPDLVLISDSLEATLSETCKKLRMLGYSSRPVIVALSKSEDINDKLSALDAGADDYLTKPFSVEELLARLRVTQRRLTMMHSGENARSSVFVNGDLRIDYAAGCAWMGEKELHLTPIEYRLLCLLAQNAGKVLTHTFITQKIWGSSWENDVASLRVFMATLRKKIEKDPSAPQYIQTHVGVGYRMMHQKNEKNS